MTKGKEDWTKAMRCVLDGHLECAAKIEEACICRKIPDNMYLEELKRLNGEQGKD
jgi:hypothetical protein